ncbi:HAD-like domain-containing protein [Polychytrium aggregatum]|uniref:HAD-like domain-containing protein n=1 Tax=Polychytrium aggregatum TaxID=110093 RepID=UPI0022FE90D8|nr:HAD-like domain-containing protein [Polychytrium aggregatum]KAI9193192.1 HAD-like domain-containing protein [Polychytrium aggregatum]
MLWCSSLTRAAIRRVPSLARLESPQRRWSHVGVAFDIDGVLVRGKNVLPEAKRAIKMLDERNIPYIFLTNGGGVPESVRSIELSKRLETKIDPLQVVLSHSPMHDLSNKYRDRPVLILGKDTCKDVALGYGFQKPFLAAELMAWAPTMCPFTPAPTQKYSTTIDFSKEPIAAIMMFHDSWDWGRDLQIACDVLISRGGFAGTISDPKAPQSVPIYFSNPDFVWSNEYPVNRFAQGAFRLALERLYQELKGVPLQYTQFGKPTEKTYRFAEAVMEEYALKAGKLAGPAKIRRKIYGIGDNPASDIEGANRNGWHSILVRTGVWRQDLHGDDHGAVHVVDHVEDAVQLLLEQEGLA